MPRRRANKRSTGFGKSGSNIVRVPFRYVRYVTAGSAPWTVAYVNLRPDQLGSKLTNIKDAYQLFRFTSLRIKSVMPLIGSFAVATPAGVSHAVAWSGEYLNNNPAFYDAMSEFPRFEISPATHPAQLRLSRRELVGEDPLKWFRTDEDEPSGTAAEDFTTQGYFYWASYIDNGGSVGAFRHLVEIEGECEFCQPKNTALDDVKHHAVAPPAASAKSFDSANIESQRNDRDSFVSVSEPHTPPPARSSADPRAESHSRAMVRVTRC